MQLGKVLTKETYKEQKTKVHKALSVGDTVFDFSLVEKVDSVAVSLLLSIKREATKTSCKVEIKNLPVALQRLIKLYGLSELLG